MTTTQPKSVERSVFLRQSPVWSRTIAMGIAGFATFTLIWAAVFQMEEAIPATGKLEPQGSVNEVKVPVGGVVKEVRVRNGDRVKQGSVLLKMDPTTSQSQVESLKKIRSALEQENAFYRAQLAGQNVPAAVKLSPETVSLTRSRAAIAAENQLYRAQLTGTAATLDSEQQLRLQARQTDVTSKLAAAELEGGQLEQQLLQTKEQLVTAGQNLALNERILSDLEPLFKTGGIAKVQYYRQQQEVLNQRSEVIKLRQERERLILAIAQSKERLRNTAAVSQEDLLARIATNDKSLAEIDSQLTKALLENQKRIAEIDSQLSQAQQTLKYQEVLAPVNGTVFELKPSGAGFVANITEPLLKIVPDDSLIAEVYITNKDIGFVKEGMPVDVRIDSFPFHEFGDIKGELIWIGSDALPPDQIRPFYHFPAKVKLDRQTLKVNDRELPLQSGMSISTNIKLRKRSILSIFTDSFMRQVESLKFIR